jgi:5'-3' exonuclease
MVGKYTLIFDGNFWLHKTYFIGQKIKQGKPFNFIDEPEADKNLLLWKLSTDFAAEIKRFEGITNRIVYTVDSSSWRKEFFPQEDYKGTRKKSSDINWSAIYEVHNEFIKSLESIGITVSRVQGAEADDLIFAWSAYLNQNGQNALIISGDNDLLQLANHDTSAGTNTIYYNKFDKDIHVFRGFEKWLNEDSQSAAPTDIFNLPVDLMSNVKQNLKDIIRSSKMKIDEVNTIEFIFRKILVGDSGDNVSPLEVKIKETKNGSKTYRVTDNQANQILNEFKENKVFVNQSHLFTDDFIIEICEIAKRVIKIEKPIEEIVKKWKINRDLVFLHKRCIPERINQAMFENIERRWKATLSGATVHSLQEKDTILRGTTYTKEKATDFTESGIFKSVMPKAEPTKGDVTITKTAGEGFDTSFWDNLTK